MEPTSVHLCEWPSVFSAAWQPHLHTTDINTLTVSPDQDGGKPDEDNMFLHENIRIAVTVFIEYHSMQF